MIWAVTYHGVDKPCFDAEMQQFQDAGLKFYSIQRVWDILCGVQFPVEDGVLITFDDLPQNHVAATPWIAKLGKVFISYVYTGAFRGQPQRAQADRGALKEMIAAGWTIGAHTHSHVNMQTEPTESTTLDLDINIRELGMLVKEPVRHFATPFGGWSAEIETLIRTRHLLTCRTCLDGVIDISTHPLKIPSYSRKDNANPQELMGWIRDGKRL